MGKHQLSQMKLVNQRFHSVQLKIMPLLKDKLLLPQLFQHKLKLKLTAVKDMPTEWPRLMLINKSFQTKLRRIEDLYHLNHQMPLLISTETDFKAEINVFKI